MNLKQRPLYLNKLLAFQRSEFIKVVVGMRRCGKSSLLKLLADNLEQQGVSGNRIFESNFEAAEFIALDDYQKLLEYIQKRAEALDAASDRSIYLLLDEIQLVSEWEKAINALRVSGNFDIYIIGSNAYLLSSQLSTLLSGRFVEIEVFPLSFKEFLSFAGPATATDQLLLRYLTYGGLPPVVEQKDNRTLIQTVLSDAYNTVFVKDIAQHIQVRNPLAFNDIAGYLADTSGSKVSITNIENKLKSAHRKTSSETIERYTQALIDSFLFYRVRRFDHKGGGFLQGLEKYYPTGLGIRSMLLGFPQSNFGFTLENAVHNELKVRGYEIRIGKAGNLEVDFIATHPERETLYIQVCASMLDEATRKRELEPFRNLTREGKRLMLAFDHIGLDYAGDTEVVNVVDRLLAAYDMHDR